MPTGMSTLPHSCVQTHMRAQPSGDAGALRVCKQVSACCHVVVLGHSRHMNRYVVPPQAAQGHGRCENIHTLALLHLISPNETSSISNGLCLIELLDKVAPWKPSNNPGCLSRLLIFLHKLMAPLLKIAPTELTEQRSQAGA